MNITPVYNDIFIFIVSFFVADNEPRGKGGVCGGRTVCTVLDEAKRKNINYSVLKSLK